MKTLTKIRNNLNNLKENNGLFFLYFNVYIESIFFTWKNIRRCSLKRFVTLKHRVRNKTIEFSRGRYFRFCDINFHKFDLFYIWSTTLRKLMSSNVGKTDTRFVVDQFKRLAGLTK